MRRATAAIIPPPLQTAANPTAAVSPRRTSDPRWMHFGTCNTRLAAPSAYTSTAPYIRRMAVWDPWVFDSGWYWQLYNSKAGPDSNLLGIFAGRASEAIGAGNSGAGVFTAPANQDAEPIAGITFESNRRSPDASVFPRVRISWGIFIGIKGLDLGDPYQVQNIARQMNLHGGINLNKVYRYQTAFPDPPGGYGPLYMNRRAVRRNHPASALGCIVLPAAVLCRIDSASPARHVARHLRPEAKSGRGRYRQKPLATCLTHW